MEVLVAKHCGFCEGVERAFRIARETVQPGKTVYMLGNLVHNKQVIEKLKAAGIKTVTSLTEVPADPQGVLLISAHGVGPEVYEEAESKGLKIIDTTCSWVKKAQKLAHQLAAEGCAVVIVGDKGHAEVRGLIGWSLGRARVVQTLQDIAGLELAGDKCVGIIAQTTQAEEHFQVLVSALKKRVEELKVHDTICGATHKRQSAAIEIAKQVGLMLVIGDQMSANTKRLAELCSATGTETYQIETASELKSDWLKGKNKVGVTAGASTPEWVVEEVTARLRALSIPGKNSKD